ncbi:unnamed protein product (macronuclear) [Paramecium tetraurelia]|uniref:Uncharacterized protein n=1 Tax=Paramecium tetraurelia TaxID=5888 RepID=A0CM30_PARTE|nr:uncharacterized protein GSPATT00008326001 [Paramecium tetraurelia]CAK71847.1 unnamed protein product [Paramecium tetraurelia]|eukprot:XP_001439244.1 hypothetical protein (macronuclear) [Paramecium tetraurelia strain d4-2]
MQQQSSVFFQCQRFIPELSEPIGLFEFTNQDVQKKLLSDELQGSFNQNSDHKPKKSLQNDKNSQSIQIKLGQYFAKQTLQGRSYMLRKQMGNKESNG